VGVVPARAARVVGYHQDRAGYQRVSRPMTTQHGRPWQAEALGEGLGEPGVDQLDVAVAHTASRIAVTACPPAAHTEISPRLPGPRAASSLASVATIRPPVAANGCPAANEEPCTLSLSRSIAPSGPSSP